MWLRATHLINFILIGMLLRSGFEILSSMPRLWWSNDCAPGKEWLKFTKRELPREEGVYTSLMDEKSLSPIISLPGRENVGLGRHWHGAAVMLWVLNGLVYVTLLLSTGLWRRIVPTSWEVFGDAWESAKIYAGFGVPSLENFQPYDALQMLAYSAVIFVFAPMMMFTGVAMSPAIRERFPRYVKMLGGHQGARSLHFLSMVCISVFIIIHVTLVFAVHREHNLVHMVFGDVDTARYAQAFTAITLTIAAVIIFWIALSYFTLADRARAHHFLVPFTELGRKFFLNPLKAAPKNAFTDADISQFHWTNGLPPTEEESREWLAAKSDDWESYRVQVGDRSLTLSDLEALPQASYIATHTCMQGWSATSRWEGPRLRDLLPPRPEGANYVLIESYGLAQQMYDNRPREPFYAVIEASTALEDRTILAIRRNGHPLEVHLGAPARLRAESQHGYKAVKWVKSIQWIADYADYGDGRGGTREDSALQAFNGRI
ncbi:molybdopterin-dependent oxidoreductase [Corynebacterium gerontici]|nr:molybdopterin-dependent oxidoreductase [Corynebacterium gerontici]